MIPYRHSVIRSAAPPTGTNGPRSLAGRNGSEPRSRTGSGVHRTTMACGAGLPSPALSGSGPSGRRRYLTVRLLSLVAACHPVTRAVLAAQLPRSPRRHSHCARQPWGRLGTKVPDQRAEGHRAQQRGAAGRPGTWDSPLPRRPQSRPGRPAGRSAPAASAVFRRARTVCSELFKTFIPDQRECCSLSEIFWATASSQEVTRCSRENSE